MCEYNRPYPVPFGQHPDDAFPKSLEPRVLPPEAWQQRLAELAVNEGAIVGQAIQDAAAIACDVHLYRSPTTTVFGISLEPGIGPNVKVWEH
jgi:hypothetical protein